jgi:hypothetical protein
MDKDKLKRLLEAPPLKFDTTNHSVAQLKKRCNEQQELILYLAQCLSTQAASIIDMRKQMGSHAGAIEAVADILSDKPEPAIIMPKAQLVGFDD